MCSNTHERPFLDVMQVALNFLENLGTPKALAVYMLANDLLVNEYDPVQFSTQLKFLRVDPQSYDQFHIDLLRDDYCAVALLSKLPPRYNSDTLRDVAITGFIKAEERNEVINKLWTCDQNRAPAAYQLLDEAGTSIETIRSLFKSILGTAPSLRTILDKGSWTQGASVGLSRRHASGELKAEKGLFITYPLARAIND